MQKLLILNILITIFFSNFIFGQSHPGIHEQEYEKYKTKEKILSKFSLNGEGIITLDTTKENKLNRSVFGYLPEWEYNNGAYNYLRYDLLSHIAAFAFPVSNTGAIDNPSAWPWTDVINKAHTNGVKVIMVAVNFVSDEIHQIISDSLAKANFIQNAKNKIDTYKLDGINIDFEGVSTADNGTHINSFMKDLTDSIHSAFPGKEVSFASPAVNWGGWDFSGLANSCDYLFVMGYDFFGSWSSTTGPVAPFTGGSINVSNTINVQYGQVTQKFPEKLILGVPYYGAYWTTVNQNAGSAVTAFVSSPYFEVTQPGSENYGILWNNLYQTPWYRWDNGKWNQVWFDNDSSLALKYNLAISKNLKGVGMWALGYDGTRQELWNLLSVKFGNGVIPPPEVPTNFFVSAENDSSVRLSYSFPTGTKSFEIFVSEDGINFDSLQEVNTNNVIVQGLQKNKSYYFKVRAKNNFGYSPETEALAATTLSNNHVLIVNSFNLSIDTTKSINFVRMYADPLIKNGYSFSSCSNQTVFNNQLNLNDYSNVIWITGNKSTETLTQTEQGKIKSFMDNGGNLFISGSGIGWDLGQRWSSASDKLFYYNYLKANCINNTPANSYDKYYSVSGINDTYFSGLPVINFDDGTHGTYNVTSPDAIRGNNGATEILKYIDVPLDSGAAGISFTGNFSGGAKPAHLVYLAFPFETIYPDSDRIQLMSRILDYFNITVDVADKNNIIPGDFKLYQNYPNPFNPGTNISFSLPSNGNASLQIFNSLGQLIWVKEENELSSGYHVISWNGTNMQGLHISSGVYIYKVIYSSINGKESLVNKMILMK
ncbi:MAG: glycosyl hydrolase family 18 protein [Ignavibacteriaceae bacterium]